MILKLTDIAAHYQERPETILEMGAPKLRIQRYKKYDVAPQTLPDTLYVLTSERLSGMVLVGDSNADVANLLQTAAKLVEDV